MLTLEEAWNKGRLCNINKLFTAHKQHTVILGATVVLKYFNKLYLYTYSIHILAIKAVLTGD